ncbi:MAG: adenylate/guanylate cyclase domain-containing protein, partial [Bacteroidota bacterium]
NSIRVDHFDHHHLLLSAKNFRKMSEKAARAQDYKQSLAYYKLYQELSQKIFADSILADKRAVQQENQLMALEEEKKESERKLLDEKRKRKEEIQRTYTVSGFALLLLVGGLIVYYFYRSKKREHKRLAIAYRDLDKTKNKLKAAEQNVFKLLKQQVSGEVAAELLSGKFNEKGERRFVCIMFLDIRDFTPMAEKLTPEELIDYQNNVFGFMIDVIHKYHGNINQLLGDGFMATFGAPSSHGNDCQNAFHAAQEILSEVKDRIEAELIPKTKIGIGLHAGFVVTGNVGTESRKQYSITGNPVIIASRVEQLNKTYKSQFIITEEVYKRLDQPASIKQPFLEVEVKGRSNPVKILKLA